MRPMLINTDRTMNTIIIIVLIFCIHRLDLNFVQFTQIQIHTIHEVFTTVGTIIYINYCIQTLYLKY